MKRHQQHIARTEQKSLTEKDVEILLLVFMVVKDGSINSQKSMMPIYTAL